MKNQIVKSFPKFFLSGIILLSVFNSFLSKAQSYHNQPQHCGSPCWSEEETDMFVFNQIYGFLPHRYTYQDPRGDIWHASFLDRQTFQIDRIPADQTPPCRWSFHVEFLSKERIPKIVIHSNASGNCPADFALVNLMPSDTLYFNSQASTITIKATDFIRKSNNDYGNWYYAGKKLEPRDKKHFKKLFRMYKESRNDLRRERKSNYGATHLTLFLSFCDPKYF